MNTRKMHEAQAKLDEYISKNNPVKLSKEEMFAKTKLALLVEIGELANATRCFKHWSVKAPESKDRLLDEYADILHFHLSIGNQIGFTYELGNEAPTYKTKSTGKTFNFLYGWVSSLNDYDYEFKQYIDYSKIGIGLEILAEQLGFEDSEIEAAYWAKHEVNYQRQKEGY